MYHTSKFISPFITAPLVVSKFLVNLQVPVRQVYGSGIFVHTEKMGRIKHTMEIKLGQILFKMGRILSDIQPLFSALLNPWIKFLIFQNSGCITFFTLLASNFMQNFRKTKQRFLRYLKTDGRTTDGPRTDGQQRTDGQGPLLRTPLGEPGVQNVLQLPKYQFNLACSYQYSRPLAFT